MKSLCNHIISLVIADSLMLGCNSAFFGAWFPTFRIGFIFESQQLEILASVLRVAALFSDFMSTGVTLFLVTVYGFAAGGSF